MVQNNNSCNNNKNDSPNKLKKQNFIPNTNTQYASFNIVSENGDSIYSLSIEDVMLEGKEQVFISLSEIRKIVNSIVDQRLGLLLNHNKNV